MAQHVLGLVATSTQLSGAPCSVSEVCAECMFQQSPIRPTHCVLQLQVVSVHVGWWNMENTVSHHSFALVVSLRLGNDYSLNFQFRPFKCHSKGMEKGWVPPDIIKVARIKSSL